MVWLVYAAFRIWMASLFVFNFRWCSLAMSQKSVDSDCSVRRTSVWALCRLTSRSSRSFRCCTTLETATRFWRSAPRYHQTTPQSESLFDQPLRSENTFLQTEPFLSSWTCGCLRILAPPGGRSTTASAWSDGENQLSVFVMKYTVKPLWQQIEKQRTETQIRNCSKIIEKGRNITAKFKHFWPNVTQKFHAYFFLL